MEEVIHTLNHECFIIDMTTGKLNCVSEKDRHATYNPVGISAAMVEHAATAALLCSL